PALSPYEPIPDDDAGQTQRDRELLQAIVERRAPRQAFADETWRLWNNSWFEQIASTGIVVAGNPLELTHHEGDAASH
ncbi:hypothetical protein, partial [Klebsiella pneumoniae]